MDMIVRQMESAAGREIYITATPQNGRPLEEQAREVFRAVADTLRQHDAAICQERVFGPANAVPLLRQARRDAYGALDDGLEPAWLVGGPDNNIRGVQVYAVRLKAKPQPLCINGTPAGRLFQNNGCRWVVTTGLTAPEAGGGEAQTRATFEKTEALLRQAGGDFTNVARTWFFLDHILDWYLNFNSTRSKFFVERGILGGTNSGRMPASTGIGVSPANNARCLMDFMAVVGPPDCKNRPEGCVCRHEAAGKQRSAYEYGSSFARAATACTPGGKTVYVSGTAAIDPAGATCFLDDVPGQVAMTIECITAVLNDRQCQPHEVVQAMAYCKTEEVERVFREKHLKNPAWPWVVIRGDVCRDNLLFEAEVTACKPK